MVLRKIRDLTGRFIDRWRAAGLRGALGSTFHFVAVRSGSTPIEQTEMLRRELQRVSEDAAAARREAAAGREAASGLQTSHDALGRMHEELARAHDALREAHEALREAQGELARTSLERQERVERERAAQGEALAWLASHHWSADRLEPPADAPPAAPLVSIVLPTWNRRDLLRDAVASVQAQVYRHWELLVVDDGSTDGTDALAAGWNADARIRCLRQPHRGVSAARNRGLAESRGELIAYLDSDDLWYPAFLARVVAAMAKAPERQCAYGATLLVGGPDGTRILHLPTDRERLMTGNVIPMTSFVHRRGLYERLGGFDESLKRLVDWDLVLRYTADAEPLAVPVIGGCYRMGDWQRISSEESQALATYRVRRKHGRAAGPPVRVLYALEFFPQLSETYVTTEIADMQRRGVTIEVWTEHEAPVPYPTDVPIRRGGLEDALRTFRPDVVHTHHLYRALRYAPTVAAAGVPMTLRGHGFEATPERLAAVGEADIIRSVYQFPHLMPEGGAAGAAKFHPMSCCFDPELYYPDAGDVDPRLVVRTALASPTKNLDVFIRLAARSPRHRFVLVPCWSVGYPDHLAELEALNASLGSPVEIRPNLPHGVTADLFRRAGICLHTHALREPYGMPVSIAEAMATGCCVIGRRSPASEAFIGDAGRVYDTEDEAAALLEETRCWSDADWRAARIRSIDRAFWHFTADRVLQPLYEEWQRLASHEMLRQ